MRERGVLGRAIIVLALSGLWVLACSPAGNGKAGGGSGPPGDRVTIFLTTELKGTTEPCGCNSNPMGDIARYAALVSSARAQGPVVVADAGSALYTSTTLSPARSAQEQLKASLVARLLTDKLGAAAVGLGVHDLAGGPAAVTPPRQAANLPASAGVPLAPPQVVDAGSVKVGIFGVVSPAAVSGAGDPVAAATAAIADLRGRGARIVVALATMDKMEAVQLARKVEGIDFLVVGKDAPEPGKVRDEPQQIGTAWLVQPANRGQVVSRLDITLRGAGPLADAIGEGRIAALERRLTDLRADLARWDKDPDADRSFVADRRKEAGALESELAGLKKQPVRAPEQGSWFTLTQVRMRKALPCDTAVVAEKVSYDRAAGKANLAAAAALPAPAPEPGKPTYVGIDECAGCHARQVEMWKGTLHARAWKTLVDVGKELDYDCIGCHVTGWERPGGATLAKNEALRDVQCEVCHGPGSVHVEELGKDQPRTIVKTPRADVCDGCHTPDHSDTFAFQPYLRDVTGPGHGEATRKSLGEGATGHELRQAALKKAGAAIGAGCTK